MTHTETNSLSVKVRLARAVAQCGWLAAAAAGICLVLAIVDRALTGSANLNVLVLAAMLCVAPGCIVLIGQALLGKGEPTVLLLAATPFRLLFVLGGTLLVQSLRPDFGGREFLIWVIVFYLATLLVETVMVVRKSDGQLGMVLGLLRPRQQGAGRSRPG